MGNMKSVLSKQLGNHNSKGPSSTSISALKTSTSSAAMTANANTRGSTSGAKQSTLGAAAAHGTNGYKKS